MVAEDAITKIIKRDYRPHRWNWRAYRPQPHLFGHSDILT
jgi:hypothetical protein